MDTRRVAGRRLTADELGLVAQLRRRAERTREMAEQAGWVCGSTEALVLSLGRWFTPAADMAVTTTYSGPASHALVTDAHVYVEGYHLANGEPRLSAWSATHAGEVLLGPRSTAYLGVPTSETFRRANTNRTREAGVLIAQPRDGFRLLRTGIPASALLHAGYQASDSV